MTNSCSPAVSVLLPVYNAQRYLSTALASLAEQTMADFEVICVDDGSTDQSSRILDLFARRDSRFRVYSQSNGGIVSALNAGLAKCSSDIVIRMDADDIAHPDRLGRQVFLMTQKPEIGICGSWVRFVDASCRPLFTYQVPIEHREIVSELLAGNGGCLIHPAIAFRKAAVEAVGGYREEALWFEDFDLYLRLRNTVGFFNIPETLLEYRQHSASVNRSALRKNRMHIRSELLRLARVEHGLEPLVESDSPAEFTARSGKTQYVDLLKRWIIWAMNEGYRRSAFIHALRVVRLKPLSRDAYRFLNLALGN